ncbi:MULTISPECIES: transglycosylase domain-containing protein [Inquilinus]|uniref:transglycosylase domain-containing protein n=1 Tax=Inquilinus TaxID=171673 RepID=UPI0035B562A9
MGIDWRRLVREGCRAVAFQKHGGASTIDMQLVRTATGYRDRKIRRKLHEALLAYIIQHRYSKLEILRSYLRIAYFGTGMKGSEAAAYRLYNMHPTQLNVDQAASVAAMLVFPRPRDPGEGWTRKHLRRANYIKAVYARYKERFDKIEERIFS